MLVFEQKIFTNCEFYKYFSYSVVGTDGGTFWSAITPEEKIRVTRNTQATTTAATIVSFNNKLKVNVKKILF